MPEERRYESLSLRAEGERLICDDEKHNHDCHYLVAAFRVVLSQMRLKDQKIKELEATLNHAILRQEVDGLNKRGN